MNLINNMGSDIISLNNVILGSSTISKFAGVNNNNQCDISPVIQSHKRPGDGSASETRLRLGLQGIGVPGVVTTFSVRARCRNCCSCCLSCCLSPSLGSGAGPPPGLTNAPFHLPQLQPQKLALLMFCAEILILIEKLLLVGGYCRFKYISSIF